MLYASSHSYTINDEQIVYVSVTIGQGALGATTVLLNGQSVAHGTAITKQSVGLGKDIKGKNLLISSAMVVGPAASLSSNTVELSGGALTGNWTDQNAGSPGDNVVYLCAVAFV